MSNVIIYPGTPYGRRGELIPVCRSVSTLMSCLEDVLYGRAQIAEVENMTPEDRCQRGPTGDPLGCVTPLVPYLTRAEWDARRYE